MYDASLVICPDGCPQRFFPGGRKDRAKLRFICYRDQHQLGISDFDIAVGLPFLDGDKVVKVWFPVQDEVENWKQHKAKTIGKWLHFQP